MNKNDLKVLQTIEDKNLGPGFVQELQPTFSFCPGIITYFSVCPGTTNQSSFCHGNYNLPNFFLGEL